jgi:hypothetical protein
MDIINMNNIKLLMSVIAQTRKKKQRKNEEGRRTSTKRDDLFSIYNLQIYKKIMYSPNLLY